MSNTVILSAVNICSDIMLIKADASAEMLLQLYYHS
jgi:hypothetical protein